MKTNGVTRKGGLNKRPQVSLYERIGSTLKKIRLQKGMKQVELRDCAGVTQGFVSGIERGKKASWEVLGTISNCLGVELEDVILESSFDVESLTETQRENILETIRMLVK